MPVTSQVLINAQTGQVESIQSRCPITRLHGQVDCGERVPTTGLLVRINFCLACNPSRIGGNCGDTSYGSIGFVSKIAIFRQP